MKKTLILLLTILLIVSCNKKSPDVDIIVTIFPFKFILDKIVANELNVDVLLPPSVDPHTYEMIPSDIIKVQKAKLFIYGDKNLDGWAAKLESENKIQLSEFVPDSLRLDISHSILELDKQSSHSHYGFDPHFWTDPITVKAMIDSIVSLLVKFFPDKRERFLSSAVSFKDELDKLNENLIDKTKHLANKNVFSSHPFYNYFFNRYNISIIGFLEISPGQAISPKEMKNIMELVKKNDVKAIFTNKQHSDKTTKVLAESIGIKHYDLDPIGGTDKITDYNSILYYNLEIIEKALK
jgi:zinc transport system substrate-binding protein